MPRPMITSALGYFQDSLKEAFADGLRLVSIQGGGVNPTAALHRSVTIGLAQAMLESQHREGFQWG